MRCAVNTERSGELLHNSKRRHSGNSKIIIIKSDNDTVEATATTKKPGNATIVSTAKQNNK
jgi:hypothetical protein